MIAETEAYFDAKDKMWHGNSEHDNDHFFLKWVRTIFEICILAKIREDFPRFFIAFEIIEKNLQKRRFVNSSGHGNSKHVKSLLRQMGFQFFDAFQSRFEKRYYPVWKTFVAVLSREIGWRDRIETVYLRRSDRLLAMALSDRLDWKIF